mgnify:CR=1 FL=1|jgi:hypothetical protein
MAQQKLPLKDILAAIDMGAMSVWDELSDDEKKQISFFLLNRYTSVVQGSREKQELAVFKTNEYYNKHFFTIQRHKKLLWQLLCLAGNTKKIEYHNWIGNKKKDSNNSKVVKLLSELYPSKKQDEIELLAKLNSKKEIIQLAKDNGIDEVKL